MSAAVAIDEFRPQDWRAARALWSLAGMSIGAAETAEGLAAFLARNPGMSVVARCGDALVGTALAGWDGRRGYLHHVAVDPAHRRHGVGRALVEAAVGAAPRRCRRVPRSSHRLPCASRRALRAVMRALDAARAAGAD